MKPGAGGGATRACVRLVVQEVLRNDLAEAIIQCIYRPVFERTHPVSAMVTVVAGPEIDLVAEECGVVVPARSAGLSTRGEQCMNDVLQLSEAAVTVQPSEDERLLEWFRFVFSQVEKNGTITLKDFKHAATSKKDVSSHDFLRYTWDTDTMTIQAIMLMRNL